MKRTIIMMILLLIVISIMGCSEDGKASSQQQDNSFIESEHDEKVIQSEGIEVYLSLEEAIDKSYCVVKAKLNSINEGKIHREYDFTLEETIIGSMNEAQFIVVEPYTDYTVENTPIIYSTDKTEYEAGREYILVLSILSSVYYERDLYMIRGDIFIELDSAGNIAEYRRYHEKEESPYKTAKEFSNHARSVTDDSKERLAGGFPFTRSSEIPDIVDASQYIVKAVVKGIHIEAPHINRDTYLCTVTETLRGSTDDEILIVLFKDTVSIGKGYLFLLNKDNEYSLIYALSSVNSVVDLEKDKSVVEEITTLISNKS